MTAAVTFWLVFCLGLVTAELNITCSQEGGYLRDTQSQTCDCNETDHNSTLQWESSDGHVLVTGHGSVTLDISFNISDPNATYICRNTRHNSTDNSTREHQQHFAYGPWGLTLDITPNSTSFDLCPSAPPTIFVTCEGRPVNPGPPGYEIQIVGTAGNILLNSSHYTYEPKTGGVWNISCESYNWIYTDINVTKSASITINEPPQMSPDLTIKNSTVLNSSTMLQSYAMFNRSTVLLEEGMMEVACSVQGGFPQVSSVSVTCDSLFKETVSGNSLYLSHPVNWTSTNATCECTAHHVTECYDLKSTVYLFVTSPLKWGTHAKFQEMTSVEIGAIVHLELSVTGFPLPTEDSADVKIGESRLDRGRFNVTLKRSGIGNEARVWLEMRPQSDEDFNNYTLVMGNHVKQMLEISFRIVRAVPPKEKPNIALIAGIAAPVGFIVIVIITVVFITRRMKSQLDISVPKGVDRTSVHVMVPEYGQLASADPVQPVYSRKADLMSLRSLSGEMSDGEDQVEQHIEGGEDQVEQHIAGGEDQLEQHIAGEDQAEQRMAGGDQVQKQIAVVVSDRDRNNNKLTSDYDNVHIKNLTLKKSSKPGRGHPGETKGSGHPGETSERGPGDQISISGPANGNYNNVKIKNLTLKSVKKGLKLKTKMEQTEQGSKSKPPPYVNVHPKPLVEDTPPLSMNTKKNVEQEADDIVNPCDTPSLDEDPLLQGVTTPSREPLKRQRNQACVLSGYVNVQPGPNDAPCVKLTVSPDTTSHVHA